MYREAARLVTAAEDPRAALLSIARDASRCERLRRGAVGVSLVVLFGLGGLLMFGRPAEHADDPGTWNAEQKAAWARSQNRLPTDRKLDATAVSRLRQYLHDDSTRVQRLALLALTNHGADVDPQDLVRLLRGSAETLDLPEQMASAGGDDSRRALGVKRAKTLRSVSYAIWVHCARVRSFPDVALIEHFLPRSEEAVQVNLLRALVEIPEYQVAAEVALGLEGGTEKVKLELAKLLKRGVRN